MMFPFFEVLLSFFFKALCWEKKHTVRCKSLDTPRILLVSHGAAGIRASCSIYENAFQRNRYCHHVTSVSYQKVAVLGKNRYLTVAKV